MKKHGVPRLVDSFGLGVTVLCGMLRGMSLVYSGRADAFLSHRIKFLSAHRLRHSSQANLKPV